MFSRILPLNNPVTIRFEGRDITAETGNTVASALLGSGIILFRESVESRKNRRPFCMIGNCFKCLVEIDGVSNLRACQIHVREGMQVNIQHGLTRLEVDDES